VKRPHIIIEHDVRGPRRVSGTFLRFTAHPPAGGQGTHQGTRGRIELILEWTLSPSQPGGGQGPAARRLVSRWVRVSRRPR
jgi:hypothetical protein